jgi:hypothetical protein
MAYFKKIDFNMKGSGLLHNKALLYFIFAISFGNFMIELINGDMYFVVIYILIGLLTTFFSKNMIVILSVAVIFANILKYGRASVEGFEEEFEEGEENMNLTEDELRKQLSTDISNNKKESSNKESTNKESTNKESYTDIDLDKNMNYSDSAKMIENQKELINNMKEFKPFMDTIQGLAKSFGVSEKN